MSDAVEEWDQNHGKNEGQPAAVVLEVWHVTQDQDHKEEGQAVNQVPHTFVVGPVNKVDYSRISNNSTAGNKSTAIQWRG